jgi:hypothetical protein
MVVMDREISFSLCVNVITGEAVAAVAAAEMPSLELLLVVVVVFNSAVTSSACDTAVEDDDGSRRGK